MNYAVHQPTGGDRLADILERVLDKGIVVAGDIKVRLIVATVDRAREIGINWWEADPMLSARTSELSSENEQLKKRLAVLEGKVARGIRPRKHRARSAVVKSGASHER
jgi:Gas vesicle protein